MHAVIDSFHYILEFAPDPASVPFAKQGRDAVGGQQIDPQLTGALKDRADRPRAFEDEIAAVLDLLHDIKATEATAGRAFLSRELGSQDKSPVVDPLLNGFAVQTVSSRLEFGRLGDRDKAVIIFDELNALADELSFNEIVAVEISGDREGEKRAHPEHHGASHRVEDVEVIMRVAAALFAHDLVVGIGGGELRRQNAKSPTLLAALDDVVNAELALVEAAMLARGDQVLLAHVLLGPDARQFMVEGKMLHPTLIILTALAQQLLGELGMTANVPEEIDDLALAHQAKQMAIDDDAIKAVINPLQIRCE